MVANRVRGNTDATRARTRAPRRRRAWRPERAPAIRWRPRDAGCDRRTRRDRRRARARPPRVRLDRTTDWRADRAAGPPPSAELAAAARAVFPTTSDGFRQRVGTSP